MNKHKLRHKILTVLSKKSTLKEKTHLSLEELSKTLKVNERKISEQIYYLDNKKEVIFDNDKLVVSITKMGEVAYSDSTYIEELKIKRSSSFKRKIGYPAAIVGLLLGTVTLTTRFGCTPSPENQTNFEDKQNQNASDTNKTITLVDTINPLIKNLDPQTKRPIEKMPKIANVEVQEKKEFIVPKDTIAPKVINPIKQKEKLYITVCDGDLLENLFILKEKELNLLCKKVFGKDLFKKFKIIKSNDCERNFEDSKFLYLEDNTHIEKLEGKYYDLPIYNYTISGKIELSIKNSLKKEFVYDSNINDGPNEIDGSRSDLKKRKQNEFIKFLKEIKIDYKDNNI